MSSDLRTLVTPEGVDLKVRLGDLGTRIGAFAIDLAIIYGSLVALFLVLLFGGALAGGAAGNIESGLEVGLVLFILVAFFLRFFYFTAFEMGKRAATPGKRIMKLRVAARGRESGIGASGARLSANMVFARNALREVEFFLPLSLAMGGGEGVTDVISTLALVWSGVFVMFPLFNRDRLRAGDLIAGTWVVRAPKTILSKDLSSVVRALDTLTFTPAQVEAYGVKELHVLENVIRDGERETQKDVAARIREKIGWLRVSGETDTAFLNAYYVALRKRLESRMLMGVRRTDKFDTR